MKKLSALLLFMLLTSGAFAQGWTFNGYFPDTTHYRFPSGGHGVAVDPYGRVWYAPFSSAVDSIWNGNAWVKCGALFCFNPDGTQASFSPIKVFVGPGVSPDSLVANTGRGLKTHPDGDILASYFDFTHKIDYKTGLSKGKFRNTVGASAVANAVDGNGNYFSANVAPGNPIKIWDPTFNFLGNAVDSSVGFSRSFEVGADGNTIYWAGYTNHAIFKYTRPDEFSPFTVTDTILKGFDCESFGWNRKYNYLWASSGSNNDLPNRYPGATTFWANRAWYAYDPVSGEIKDSLLWNMYPGATDSRPRGIAFSPSGDTAYVTCFGSTNYPPIERFINPNPSSIKDLGMTVQDYKLFQNYPNPFNPSTEIRFSLKAAGFTTLKIYDILGKEVATLVSENLNSGMYAYSFDASKLASGTYIYEVVSNNVRLTNKMLLMK